MKKIKIIGTYITKFGELWDRSLESLFEEAIFGSLNSVAGSKFKTRTVKREYGTFSKLPRFNEKEIDAVFVANMAGGQFANQSHLNALVSGMLSHNPPAFRVEAACASGGMALEMAELALKSGKYKTVLVVGAEKMTDVVSGNATQILSGASDYQKEYGSTFPALYALLEQAHMQKFGTTREQLSAVASKNHKHALSNPKAQFRKNISRDVISKSTVIASPIRLLDCSPVSDGAAAVILTTKNIKKYANKPVIEAVGHGQDSLSLADRESLTELKATKLAAGQAFSEAGVKPKNISFAEVHDCFTIAEILAIEDLGFFKKGTGGEVVESGRTTYGGGSENGNYDCDVLSGKNEVICDNDENSENKSFAEVVKSGRLVINPSGGLKACGHPVGATGIKQVAFLAELLEKKVELLEFGLDLGEVSLETLSSLAKSSNLDLEKQKVINIGVSSETGSVKNRNQEKFKNNKIYALAHNVGGSGATAIVHILSKEIYLKPNLESKVKMLRKNNKSYVSLKL